MANATEIKLKLDMYDNTWKFGRGVSLSFTFSLPPENKHTRKRNRKYTWFSGLPSSRRPRDKPIQVVSSLLKSGFVFYCCKNHPVLIPSSLFFVTSRFTWSYLYYGLKSDDLKMGTQSSETYAPAWTWHIVD